MESAAGPEGSIALTVLFTRADAMPAACLSARACDREVFYHRQGCRERVGIRGVPAGDHSDEVELRADEDQLSGCAGGGEVAPAVVLAEPPEVAVSVEQVVSLGHDLPARGCLHPLG